MKWINLLFFWSIINILNAQQKFDTSLVITTAAVDYFIWKGYNNNENDTTKTIKKIIRFNNKVVDSIISIIQKQNDIIFSDELINQYKNNYFSLASLINIYDTGMLFTSSQLPNAFAKLLNSNNKKSFLEELSNESSEQSVSIMLFNGNKERSYGAGWNSVVGIDFYKKQIPLIGIVRSKPVTINGDSNSLVYINNKYKGPTGETYAMWLGQNYIIEIKKNDTKICSFSLAVPENDDCSPKTVECPK